ncbi:MAG: spondin domain-containing protein [Litoreibacter sp.]
MILSSKNAFGAICGALLATTALSGAASATAIEVTIQNTSGANGLFLTPFLNVFHDGSYSAFETGEASSASLEALAEDGAVGGEATRAGELGHTTAVATGPSGFGAQDGQPPVLDPGEATTFVIDLDPTSNRYFSFLSMIIPSNDTFIGNGNPLAYELFDENGDFTGLDDIAVDLDDVWDAGTEFNSATGIGAAFNVNGGGPFAPNGEDEGGTVQGIGDVSELSFLFGQNTPAGVTTSAGAVDFSLLASISFSQAPAPVPLPAGLSLMLGGLGLMGGLHMRRKQRS